MVFRIISFEPLWETMKKEASHSLSLTVGIPEQLRYSTTGNALVVPLIKAMGKRISALAEDEQRS